MADKPYETRTVTAALELRDADTSPVLEGYAATFNQPYDLGPFREQIAGTAFNRTLGTKPDVRLLIDHEGQPLARTKSDTLQLEPDSTGLHIRAMLDPSDPDVQRLLPKMRRGDLDQMSFAFRVPNGGDEWSEDYSMRTLRNVELNGGDVSVVTYPANPNTSVSVRAEDVVAARWTLAETLMREIRSGNGDMQVLLGVLAQLAAADNYLDEALEDLSETLGVPNPDVDESTGGDEAEMEMQANSGRPLGVAKAVARSLGL